MIEFLLVTITLIIVINVVKPGRTPPLLNPLVIERVGQYHITLAPQLNLAQPFIEAIARQLGNPGELSPNSSTRCFEIRDPEVTAHGKDFYLLAITQRNGMLYFQATASQAAEPKLRTDELLAFANKTLINHPISGEIDNNLNEQIIAAAHEVSKKHGSSITNLGDHLMALG